MGAQLWAPPPIPGPGTKYPFVPPYRRACIQIYKTVCKSLYIQSMVETNIVLNITLNPKRDLVEGEKGIHVSNK